jgi:hypothetical protein
MSQGGIIPSQTGLFNHKERKERRERKSWIAESFGESGSINLR